MRTRTLLPAALLLLPVLAAAASPTTRSPDMADGDSRFALNLYAQLGSAPGNLFFSPASLRIALAMAYGGAKGPTAEEMRQALALPEGPGAHDALAAQLERWRALAEPTDHRPDLAHCSPEMKRLFDERLEKRRIALNVANRLWAQSGKPLREDYLALLRDKYRAPLGPLDFIQAPEPSRVAINRWVSEQTAAKIPELLPPNAVNAATRVVLTNAVYFKAAWSSPFEPEATRDGPFHVSAGKPVTAKLMHQVDRFKLARTEGGALLELPYGDGDLALDVLLPDAKDGLPALERAVEARGLAPWLDKLQGQRVDVTLPRWKTSAALQVAEKLQALGMKAAFQYPAADFSGIDGSRELFLSAVVHQAVIAVDEAGTEAAAATAVMMEAGAAPRREPDPVVFRADHPFLYAIRDTRTGALLFLGRLADPSR